MSDLETLLSSAEVGELRVSPLVVLDWRDGPLEGFAEVSGDDQCWHFRIVADRFRPDDIDDRVFSFARLAIDASSMVRAIKDEALPEKTIVDQLLAAVGPPLLLVQAPSFDEVKAVWRLI